MTITPTTAYLHNNIINIILEEPYLSGGYINWGDGHTEILNNNLQYNHSYTQTDTYDISVYSCSSIETSSVNISLLTNPSISSIRTEYTTTGCKHEIELFVYDLSSVSTILLYASGSNSYPYEDPQMFWSHLHPQWRFLDDRDNVINSITLSGTPVYDGDIIVGYTSNTKIYYVDDMPGNPVLFFTLEL